MATTGKSEAQFDSQRAVERNPLRRPSASMRRSDAEKPKKIREARSAGVSMWLSR
jgi:hypothetical protein